MERKEEKQLLVLLSGSSFSALRAKALVSTTVSIGMLTR